MAASAAALAPACPDTDRAAINRANAQHSTGPRSAEGKAHSAQNALKYGLFASVQHLPPAEFAILDHIICFTPHVGDTAHVGLQAAALHMAVLEYRLDRVRRLEYSTYVERMRTICKAEDIPEPTDLAERGVLEARIFREDAEGPRTLSRLHTHERFFTRQLALASAAVSRLKEKYYPTPWKPSPEIQAIMDRDRAAAAAAKQSIDNLEAEADSGSRPSSTSVASFSENDQIPRSAPCPCGSGLKYKRCCGKAAPAVLQPAA